MRLSDLRNAEIRTLDGERLGRVHEVHADGGRIVALICGPGSLIERLTAKAHGRRIPWERVKDVKDGHVRVVTTDPPPSKAPSASRTRPGTPRPSGRRSKR
jgi:sporulation protein YlmC with PRC-barrel domain